MEEKRIIIGSRAVGMNNENSDYEYVQFSDSVDTFKIIRSGQDSIYLWNPQYLNQVLNYKENPKFQLTTYLFDKDLNSEAMELGFDIMEHLDDMRDRIKRFCILHEEQLGKVQSKLWYHVAYQYFILKNNSKQLSEEQLDLVKSIHDHKPMTEFLKEMIDDIKTM